MLPNPNEVKPDERPPPMRINEETAKYLWNLAQKSNLTVTTAPPIRTQIDQAGVKQEQERNNEQVSGTQQSGQPKTAFSETTKVNWKEPQETKQQSSVGGASNPFAALPLSLIKNGILSVTSDSACVEIENGVPILKETTETAQPPSVEQKSAVTIEALPMKFTPATAAPTILREKNVTPAKTRQLNSEGKAEQLKMPENPIIAAQIQRKMLMQNQIIKALIKHPGVRPLPPNSLIPNSSQMEFAALLGLELVTGFCLSEHKNTPKLLKPDSCAQCGTDFSPRWHSGSSNSSQKLCERCFFWHMRLKNTEERTKQYQAQAKLLQKGIKLTPLKVTPQTQPAADPQECFKNYLNALISSGANCYDSNFGFSDLTKLGASIAANAEIVKAMDNLRSLNNAATPEVRAKAIQNLQLAFYKGLAVVSNHSNGIHYQSTVAQLAQKSGLTAGSNAQTTQRRTGAPLEAFERAIKEHKQRLLKIIQSNKT